MRFRFSENNAQMVVDKLNKSLKGRKLGELVSLEVGSKGEIVVTISKLGTSTLSFAAKKFSKGLEFNLSEEKIAFAHRAFKSEVVQKFIDIITKAGGEFVS